VVLAVFISIETENPDFAVSGFGAVAIGLQINHDINSNSNSVSAVLITTDPYYLH